MGARMAPKQRLANIRRGPNETDRAYIERFDKVLLEGEQVDEDAKVIGVVGGLTIGAELWKSMNKEWPKTYAEFRERAGVIITMAEVIAQEMGDKKGSLKRNNDYRPPNNMKSFSDNKEMQNNLKKVLAITIDEVYNNVKDRGLLSPPRKIHLERSKLNRRKFCSYHGDIGHFTSECRDLLRQLWRCYEDGKLGEFVKKSPALRIMPRVDSDDDDDDDQVEDLREELERKKQKIPPMPKGQPREINTLQPDLSGNPTQFLLSSTPLKK